MEGLEGIADEIKGVKSVVDEIKERIESRVNTNLKEINELKGVLKEVKNEISIVKKENQFVDSKVDGEITKIQKIESVIKKMEVDLLKMQQMDYNLESKIGELKTQQDWLSSKIVSLELKKAVEEFENLIKKKKQFFDEVAKVVDKIEETMSALLALTVQLNFGNNFLGFVVQYHSTCGNWWIFFLLTIAMLFFLGSNSFFSWCRVSSNFNMIEYLCRDGENLKEEFVKLNRGEEINSIIYDAYWPNPQSIRKKYVNRFWGIIGCVGVHCILVTIGCHYLFCGQSNVLGPLLSALSVT